MKKGFLGVYHTIFIMEELSAGTQALWEYMRKIVTFSKTDLFGNRPAKPISQMCGTVTWTAITLVAKKRRQHKGWKTRFPSILLEILEFPEDALPKSCAWDQSGNRSREIFNPVACEVKNKEKQSCAHISRSTNLWNKRSNTRTTGEKVQKRWKLQLFLTNFSREIAQNQT